MKEMQTTQVSVSDMNAEVFEPTLERPKLVTAAALAAAERGWLPDAVIRYGIRRLAAERLRDEARRADRDGLRDLLRELQRSPIARDVELANHQHYELPTSFFTHVLGSHLKYSSGYWPDGVGTLDTAETAMLDLTCQRAGIEDGMRVLDLGCGWGAMTLWIAQRYPRCQVRALSNSQSQAAYIRTAAAQLGTSRIEVVTGDINTFDTGDHFDRVVSVEMFEHARNYERLFNRIHGWLAPGGRLFVHVFSHRTYAYLFESAGPTDWMGRYFFTSGTMPSQLLFAHFQRDFLLEDQWLMNGRHYARTAEAWLRNLDAHRAEILPIFGGVYGQGDAERWFGRWRIFFLACAELFGFRQGREWGVSHYLFAPRAGAAA